MKVAKRSHEATSVVQGIPVESLEGVAIQSGEAIVGPLTEILAGAFVPGDGGRPWLYFSVPQSTFEALESALASGAIEVKAMLGAGDSADSVWVRVRVFGHCALINIPANDKFALSALEVFAQAGRIRILVVAQTVRSAPLPIEVAWKAPTSTWDALALQRDLAFLRIESEHTGSISQLTTCTAETTMKRRERLEQASA